jgi:hypothetical protein
MPGVKPGDLAITKNCKHSGVLMEILEAAPTHGFNLPNGQYHRPPVEHPAWVVKLLSGPFMCKFSNGRETTKMPVTYGVAHDRYVYPLPGDDVEEETVVEQTVS